MNLRSTFVLFLSSLVLLASSEVLALEPSKSKLPQRKPSSASPSLVPGAREIKREFTQERWVRDRKAFDSIQKPKDPNEMKPEKHIF